MKRATVSFLILLYTFFAYAQVGTDEDSICKFGKKYDLPHRKTIAFPASDSSETYKLRELKKAVPAWWFINSDSIENYGSITDQRNLLSRIYQYYFLSNILDYDERGDTIYSPKADSVLYKLKDTYVFDINGDGLPDLIHYPKYYRRFFMDGDFYDMFIQQKDGSYKMLNFDGYICDITFNPDNTINSLKTFSTGVDFENHRAVFFWYTFDKAKSELLLTRKEELLKCQLKKE